MNLKARRRDAVKENSPLHHQFAEQVRRQIVSGELKPGDRLLSYAQAREQYGVHTNTLEKAHAQLEREGLIVRRRGKGTFVATPQWSPRKNQGVIGVAAPGFVFAQLSNYWMQLLHGVQAKADEEGVHLLFLNHKSLDGWEKADGVLVCDWSSQLILPRVPDEMPCVLLMSPAKNLPSVEADDYAGARDATRHLLDLGHRRIAYLHAEKIGIGVQRFAGYRAALETAGIEPCAAWEYPLETFSGYGAQIVEFGYETMTKWLRDDWSSLGCTSLLAHNDDIAFGAIKALQEFGLRVPEDVSVVGFDGTDLGAYCTPKLTTVQWPLEKIGALAMELLLQRISGDQRSEQVGDMRKILSGRLLVRESTAPPDKEK